VRVRFSTPFPFSILHGGLEVQAEETLKALRRRGIDAEFLDPGPTGEPFDLLHAFGPGIGVSEFVPYLEPRTKLVVSLLSGGAAYSRSKAVAKRLVTSIAQLARQRTEFAIRRSVLDGADRIVILTTWERDYAARTYGISLKKFVVIPNGVDARFFVARAAPFHEHFGMENFVLFVGSVIPRKNPLNLARALATRGLPGVFIGPAMPAFAGYAREFADVIAAASRLTWVPKMQHANPLLPSAYAAACLVCLPSTSESQPLAALEALAAGRPVIVGDRPYAMQPPLDSCVTCNPLSPTSIGNAVEQVLRGEASGRPSTVPSWDDVAADLEVVYREVVDDNQD
jgi:glycosyltransferase involved in cell wall biosynthesis